MIRKLIILIVLFSNFNFAQQFTKSPFSANGIGEEDYTGNATFTSLGNVRSSYIDSSVLNIYNPSSYSFLSHGQPIFSTGAYIQNYQFVQNGSTSKNNALALSHISFGFSFKNRLGLAFGVRPLTNTGYDVVKSTFFTDTITTQLFGSGNLSYAFTGFSFKVFNFNKHKLALGVNLGNVFGTNLNRQTVHIQNELIGSIKQSSLKINGFNPEYGLNYQCLISKASTLSVSAIYKSKVSLNFENKTALIAAADFKNENSFDTLNYSISSGKLFNPSSYELGLKYDLINFFNISSQKKPQFIFLAAYKRTNWSDLNSFVFNSTLNDSKHYSFGFQFSPHFDFYDRSKTISFYSRIKYRFGYEFSNSPWSINSKQVNTSSYSVGVGIPITSQRTLSSLNFCLSYGNRSNGVANDFNEKQLGYILGITISPAFYDRWFKKNKIE